MAAGVTDAGDEGSVNLVPSTAGNSKYTVLFYHIMLQYLPVMRAEGRVCSGAGVPPLTIIT